MLPLSNALRNLQKNKISMGSQKVHSKRRATLTLPGWRAGVAIYEKELRCCSLRCTFEIDWDNNIVSNLTFAKSLQFDVSIYICSYQAVAYGNAHFISFDSWPTSKGTEKRHIHLVASNILITCVLLPSYIVHSYRCNLHTYELVSSSVCIKQSCPWTFADMYWLPVHSRLQTTCHFSKRFCACHIPGCENVFDQCKKVNHPPNDEVHLFLHVHDRSPSMLWTSSSTI
jgi:hypothetical protein